MSQKIRILQQNDGSILTWTKVLETRPDVHPGWLYVRDDGSRDVVLDKVNAQRMYSVPTSEREKILIEELENLRKEVAGLKGFVVPNLQEGEVPIEANDVETDITPSVPKHNKRDIQRMKRDELVDLLKTINPNADEKTISVASREELIETCLILMGLSNE